MLLKTIGNLGSFYAVLGEVRRSKVPRNTSKWKNFRRKHVIFLADTLRNHVSISIRHRSYVNNFIDWSFLIKLLPT